MSPVNSVVTLLSPYTVRRFYCDCPGTAKRYGKAIPYEPQSFIHLYYIFVANGATRKPLVIASLFRTRSLPSISPGTFSALIIVEKID
jgi:hypothetical protein